MFRKSLWALCLIFILVNIAVPAHAQSAREQELINRLERLQNEVETLSHSLYRGEKPDAEAVRRHAADPYRNVEQSRIQADLEVRMSQLQNELRVLTGRLEEQNHRIRILENKLSGTAATNMSAGAGFSGPSQAAPYGTPYNPARGVMQAPSAHEALAPYPQGQVMGQAPGGDSLSVSSLLNHGAPQQHNPAPQMMEQNLPEYLRNSIQSAPADGKIRGQLGVLRINPDGSTEAVSGLPADGEVPANQVNTSGEMPSPQDLAGDPNAIYQQAFSFLRDKNYAQAEKYFRDFLSSFPEHNLVQNAKYWLGETYYVRDDFERAARLFAEGYQTYPQGSKAPDNLLKLGLSLANLGNQKDACLTLSQLKRKFQTGAGPVLDRAEREMQDMNCQ